MTSNRRGNSRPSNNLQPAAVVSAIFTGLLSLANWLGNFIISGLWWLAQLLWWLCNFVGSLVLSGLGLMVGLLTRLLGKNKRSGLGKFSQKIQTKTGKYRAGILGKIFSKPMRRRLLPGLAVVVLFLAGFAVYQSRQAPEAEAGWWNETWVYRRAIEISNSNGTDLEDFQVAITLDTAALIAAGKMQAGCEDLRITDTNGKILPHWIEENLRH